MKSDTDKKEVKKAKEPKKDIVNKVAPRQTKIVNGRVVGAGKII